MTNAISLLELLLKRDGYVLEYRGKPKSIFAPCVGKRCLRDRMAGKIWQNTFRIERKRGGRGKCDKCRFSFTAMDYLMVSPRDPLGEDSARMLVSSSPRTHRRYIDRTKRVYGFSILKEPSRAVAESL